MTVEQTLENALEEAAEEAWSGQAGKQAELVNQIFRLDSVELIDYTDARGQDAQSYIATIVVNGEEDPREYWLGGRMVMPQVKVLVEGGHLPVYLRLVLDTEKKGQPYKLVGVGDTPAPTPEPASGPRSRETGHPHMDTLVKFCKDNRLANENGKVNAALVLEKLGIKVSSTKKPSEQFAAYTEKVRKEYPKEWAGDAVYQPILGNLIEALTKGKKEPAPEPAEVPFE